MTASLDTKLGVQLQSSQKVYLGKILGPEVTFPVGPMPVAANVVFTFYAVLSTSGTIGIEYDAFYSHTLAATCQVGLTGGQQRDLRRDVVRLRRPPTRHQPSDRWHRGPRGRHHPQVELSASSADPWWTLGLSAALGVDIVVGEFWLDDASCAPGARASARRTRACHPASARAARPA